MGVEKWFKKQAALISLAMASVEKDVLSQGGKEIGNTINQEQRNTQGTLLDSLKEGRVTQEVKDLRWRMYKIMMAADGLKTEIVGYDPSGTPITKTYSVDKLKGLSKVKVDSFDSFQVEMVVDAKEIKMSGNDAINNPLINIFNEPEKYIDKDGNEGATHGEIKALQYSATNKGSSPLIIGRDFIPKFTLEDFTTKLVVRKINETERLLEFYVSMYPNENLQYSTQFLNDIKKTIENPKSSNFLEIKEVGFVTNKTIGVHDYLSYHYNITSLDKIVQFNGNYVIKYIATININGENILEKYREEELDEKYNKKQKRKKNG